MNGKQPGTEDGDCTATERVVRVTFSGGLIALLVQDPEDEEEQHRVRSQAQALLDCVADLVVHSGLQGAINLLAEGAQLQRVPSGTGSLSGASQRDSPRSGSDGLTRMGSETWRIIGSLPVGFGEGMCFLALV